MAAFSRQIAAVVVLVFGSYGVLCAQDLSADNAGVVRTPTPDANHLSGSLGDSRQFSDGQRVIDRSGYQKHREFLVRHYAEQGVVYDPGEIGKEEDLSPHEMARRYGPPGDYYEPPPDEKVTGCLYTVGASAPDVCLGENGEEVYNSEVDDFSVFEALKDRSSKK